MSWFAISLTTELDDYVGEAVAYVRPHEIGLGRANGHDIAQATIDSFPDPVVVVDPKNSPALAETVRAHGGIV